MDTRAARTSGRKLEENMNANRNYKAFTMLLLGSSSDATKEKKGMLMASNRRGKKQGAAFKVFPIDKTYQVWKELDRRWPAVVQLKLSKGDATTGQKRAY